MNDSSRMRKLEQAQLHVLFNASFFAPGVMKLENQIIGAEEAAQIFSGEPTACTDGKTIKWYGPFLDSLQKVEAATVMCHEVWHCLAGHLWRVPVGVDWDLWNIAADHETNTMIKEFSAISRQQGKFGGLDPFPFPKPEERFYANPKYSGWAVEAIYADLYAERQKDPNRGKKTPQAGTQGGKQGTPEPGSMPNFGQMIKPGLEEEKAELSNSWTNTMINSAKMAGTLPGNLQRLIENIVSPQLDWTEILRSWLREQSTDDWNFDIPAVEYEPSGFVLPTLHSERTGPVIFGSDWSGSTYGALVDKFHAEKQNCLDTMSPSKLIDIGFDTRVLWEKEYTPGDTIDPRVAGGGGTSFVDVLRRGEELDAKAVVILTDLEGEFPKKAPSFPVIWVVYGNPDKKAPFGETIHAN